MVSNLADGMFWVALPLLAVMTVVLLPVRLLITDERIAKAEAAAVRAPTQPGVARDARYEGWGTPLRRFRA